MKRPVVSIWCAAYNYREYIRDALEGFLMQETDFPYEVVVYDDASTDGTSDIIREYALRYPDIIHAVIAKRNTFRDPDRQEKMLNLKRQKLTGRYIALCEGDDYWTDRNKLQIQVDYMEQNPKCMLCAHNAKLIDYKENSIRDMNTYDQDRVISPEEIIMQSNGIMPTASFLMRAEIQLGGYLYRDAPFGDYPLQLYAITKGYIFYFNRVMSVYRYKHAASWSKANLCDMKSHMILMARSINLSLEYNKFSGGIFERYVQNRIQANIFRMIHMYGGKGGEEFIRACMEYNAESESRYHSFFMEWIRLWKQMNVMEYCDPSAEKIAESADVLLIMGTGRYAGILSQQLQHAGIQWDGYVVSDNHKTIDSYLGKTVWELHELPFKKENISVLVAINYMANFDVLEALRKAEIIKFYFPFSAHIDSFENNVGEYV